MTDERKRILDRVNQLIDKRKEELLSKFPHIHEIGDGLIIRFFTDWDNCQINEEIKYKIIKSERPEDNAIFHFIPKGTILKKEKREYARVIICLDGHLELQVDDEFVTVNAFSKVYPKNLEFTGKALEDTYVVTMY